MDVAALRAAYDAQLRRDPPPEPGGAQVQRTERITRVISDDAGWAGVVWSDLDAAEADEAIAEEVRRFTRGGRRWEWKYHTHDTPADLPDRLCAAGLVPDEPETVMVAELSALSLNTAPPAGVTLREVRDAADIAAFVAVQTAVFGGDRTGFGRYLASRPAHVVAVVAWAGDEPIGAGRVELSPGCEFAGIWGGGTVAPWRHRGVFRALVARRAAVAAQHGFRYLQVDASSASRPILARLGFQHVATAIAFRPPG